MITNRSFEILNPSSTRASGFQTLTSSIAAEKRLASARSKPAHIQKGIDIVDLTSIIGNAKPKKRISQRQLKLRARLWPTHSDGHIWLRQKHDGFTTLPRTILLILSIVDDLAGIPVGAAYLELWCRAFDEGFVTLAKQREVASHVGFDGQRGERTWRTKMKHLADLGFIDTQSGPSGPMSYALILNPYLVIRRLHDQKQLGLREDKYNALVERAGEIGTGDFGLPDPWKDTAVVAAAAE